MVLDIQEINSFVMLDKDKVIIVVYAGARTPEETYHLIEQLQKHFDGVFDDSVRTIFTPMYNEVGIKFECINPVLLNEEQYKEVNKTFLSELERVADHLVNIGYAFVHPTGDEEVKVN